MIRVIAIDDEPLALLQLQRMIEKTPFFTLAAACQSALDAMKVMEEESVDAIFADINMPDLSGLDFIRSLTNPPIIVFTTAYSQYALDGYKVNAIDYLLKPFGQPEFQRAAAKVKKQYELLHPAASKQHLPEEEYSADATCEHIDGDMLFVKVDYRIVRISISGIRYIESQSEYLKLHMQNGPDLMVLMSIKRMAELLPKDRFVRIHRSYIVNMSHAVEIAKMRVRIDEDTFLPIGDLYKEDTLKFINDRLVGR